MSLNSYFKTIHNVENVRIMYSRTKFIYLFDKFTEHNFFPDMNYSKSYPMTENIYCIKDFVNFVFRPFYLHWLSYCLPKYHNKGENVILNATLLKALNVQLNKLTTVKQNLDTCCPVLIQGYIFIL